MHAADYQLHIRSENVRRITTAWLMLGLASLVGAGIFSILLVLARTPAIQEMTPLIDFFRIASFTNVWNTFYKLFLHIKASVLIQFQI